MEAATASYDTPERGRVKRPLSAERFTFQFRARVLGVTTSDAWARELLTSTYEPMLREAKRARELAHIEECDGFQGAFYAVRDVFADFAAREPHALAFYGASIAVGGAGVLVLGRSGIGKTVLSLNLAYRGAQFLGDETALLDLRSGGLYALPRRASLREPGLAHLLDASAARAVALCPRAHVTPKGRLWYALDDVTLNVRFVQQAYPLRAVVLLEEERAAQPAIAEVPVWEFLPHVSARIHGKRESVSVVADLYAHLRNARGFRVCVGPASRTTDLLLETLHACA